MSTAPSPWSYQPTTYPWPLRQCIIDAAGVSVEVYDGVESNPKDHNVMDVHVDAGRDGFISLGGGSSP